MQLKLQGTGKKNHYGSLFGGILFFSLLLFLSIGLVVTSQFNLKDF